MRRIRGTDRIVAQREPLYVKIRSIILARALRQLGPLDGVIAMGTDLYDLDRVMHGRPEPVVTFDDGNFTLFLKHPESDLHLDGYPIQAVRAWAEIQRSCCHRAKIACACTEWAGKSLVEDFGLPPDRVRIVGVGHRPRGSGAELRDWTTPRFLFVGINWKRKNGAAVLDAFSRIRERFPNATLDLAGGHPAVNMPGVTGHGLLSRKSASDQLYLDRLFSKATVFVLPSLFEPAGIAYLEAASAGLAVIGTTAGGAGELLGDAAISVDPHDRNALTRAMLQLCDMDFARLMGERARKKAADSTWPAVSRRLDDALRDSIAG